MLLFHPYIIGGVSLNMIELDEMKTIELEMMKQVHAFCASHSIRYSLGYGTLLGAIRHKGFIPWDDDIDLIMPRPDYDEFIKTFNSDVYCVVSSLDTGYYYPYAKVYDKRTFLKEELRYTYPDMGVFIDVFPVDGLPASLQAQERLYSVQKFLYKLHMSMKYHVSREWSLLKNFLVLVSRVISLFYPLKRVIKKIEKNYLLNSYDASEDVAVLLGEIKLVKIPKSSFEHLGMMAFEDSQFLVVPDVDSLLTKLYGDYMTPPPPEKQTSEHRYTVGWKK